MVTHVDGLALEEEETVEGLRRLLQEQTAVLKEEDSGGYVLLTLNLERPVAEALKRRAIAIAEDLDKNDKR